MNFIALMPMKGHSERIPRKNLRNFNGKPLYHMMVQTLLKSKYIDKIVIDTDSEEIVKDIRGNFPSIHIIIRNKLLCGDMVSMNKIIEYDINQLHGEYFIQTHSTNPLLTSDTLDKAMMMLMDNEDKYDSIFSVTELKARLYDNYGKPVNHNPYILERTQDLNSIFEENSNFYIFSRESFNKRKCRIGEKPFMYIQNKLEALDIDYEEDFIIAESIAKNIKNEKD